MRIGKNWELTTNNEGLPFTGLFLTIAIAAIAAIIYGCFFYKEPPTTTQPSAGEIATIKADLEATEPGSILSFRDGNIAVVRRNFQGKSLSLRGSFANWIVYNEDVGILTRKVQLVVNKNHPHYESWKVVLFDRLVGPEASITQPATASAEAP